MNRLWRIILIATVLALAASASAVPTPRVRVCDGPLADGYDWVRTLGPRSVIPLCHEAPGEDVSLPVKYRYLVAPAVAEWYGMRQYVYSLEEYLQLMDGRVEWASADWSDWLPYESGASSVDTGYLAAVDEHGFQITYLFALQAMDAEGGVSIDSGYAEAVHNFVVSTDVRATLTLVEPDLGEWSTSSLFGEAYVWVAPGDEVSFSWSAEAAPYSDIASYRWGWDVVDYTDPDDPGWAVEPGLGPEHTATGPVSFAGGDHELVVQCVDLGGVMTRMRCRVMEDEGLVFRILEGETDPFNPDDERVYPYYEVTRPDGSLWTQTFARGDTIPMRARVVFKAVGREAEPERPDEPLEFQGRYECTGRYWGSEHTLYSFASMYSEANHTPEWTFVEGGADTLSFLVGPFAYELTMRGSRDGLPIHDAEDVFAFQGNRPPRVDCVEVVDQGEAAGYHLESCVAPADTFYCSLTGAPVPGHEDWTSLQQENYLPVNIWYSVELDAVWYERPDNTTGLDSIGGYFFEYDLLLHAQDDVSDRLFLPADGPGGTAYGDPADRMFSWRYEIVSEFDPFNQIEDGTGFDGIEMISYSFAEDYADSYDDNGVWRLPVRVFVPQFLLVVGMEIYYTWLAEYNPGWNVDQLRRAIELTTGQLGVSVASFKARDATAWRPDRCAYLCYERVRVPEDHDEACEGWDPAVLYRVPLNEFAFDSEVYERPYVIKMVTAQGEIYPPLE